MTRTDSPLVDHAKQMNKSTKENAPRKSKKKSSLSKKERLERNAKGWMEGLRERYMQPLVNEYADAQMRGQKAEKLKMNEILRKFHFWFPYPLEDHEEPNEIKAYDPHYVEPEGSAEFEAAKGAHLQKYNKRVKAWIMSRLVRKEGKRETKVSKQALVEPFTILMAKLAGLTKPPHAHSAQQQWQIANWTTGLQVEEMAIKEWNLKRGVLGEANAGAGADSLGAEADDLGAQADDEGEDTAPPPTLPRSIDAGTYPPIDFVGTVSRRMFATLPAEERAQWKRNAQEESRIEKEAYEKHMSEPLGSSPTSRATCVRNAPEFISKLNQGIEQASSLRLMTLAAGPMARKQGDVGFFMVTTSTNRGAVPMSFQEWYGEEKTKELMNAYKEWTESCLTPSEVQEVLGKGASEEMVPNERYTGMLGKGFTTDDMAADLGKGKGRRREGLLVPTTMSPPNVEGVHSKPAETRKPRTLRKKAGEDGGSDDSSSDDGGDDIDKWSEKSSSEDSAMDTDDHDDSQENNDTDIGRVAAVVKRKREEQKEARRRKKARAGEKPSRRSARMLDLVQKDSVQTTVDTGDGEGDGDNHEMDVDRDTSGATKSDGNQHQHQVRPDEERLGVLSRTPSPLPADTNDRALSRTPSPPPADTNDRALSRTPSPPLPDTNNVRARELLIVSFPYTSIGLEKGTFCVADGLGTLTGFLLCDRSGLDFLLLPLNEFLQAKGGDHLKVAMERLIAIEIALLDGNIRDDAGRKKAVVPVSTRPKVLSSWIGYGRCRVGKSGAPVPRRVIEADALDGFGKTWRTWWAGLQPGWRVRLESDDGWERSEYGEDWHSLTIPGQNGLLSVIATLSWWGSAVMETGNGTGEWLEAVSDVEWMLAGLLGALEKRRA